MRSRLQSEGESIPRASLSCGSRCSEIMECCVDDTDLQVSPHQGLGVYLDVVMLGERKQATTKILESSIQGAWVTCNGNKLGMLD